jgi:hypothetical protein
MVRHRWELLHPEHQIHRALEARRPNTIDYEVTVEDPTTFTRSWKMNYPKRRDGTGPTGGPRALPGATTGLPSRVADNPYAKEVWEEACFEGNHENTITLREIGFKWFGGVTPPK